MAVPLEPRPKKITPVQKREHSFLTFHFCPAPAGPLSKVLGSVTMEFVDDPNLQNPVAAGIAVYDTNQQPLVAILPGNLLLALAAVEHILRSFDVDTDALAEQARISYEVI